MGSQGHGGTAGDQGLLQRGGGVSRPDHPRTGIRHRPQPQALRAHRRREGTGPMSLPYRLQLPVPPSLHVYYDNAKRTIKGGARAGQSYIGRKVSALGLRFRGEVQHEVRRGHRQPPKLDGRLSIVVLVCKATHTRAGAKATLLKGDLDNLWKCLLDALTEAQVIGDDVQFDDVRMIRGNQYLDGRVFLCIDRFNPDAALGAAAAAGLPFTPDYGATRHDGLPF